MSCSRTQLATRVELEPQPLDPESEVLTTRHVKWQNGNTSKGLLLGQMCTYTNPTLQQKKLDIPVEEILKQDGLAQWLVHQTFGRITVCCGLKQFKPR